jgi:hypothetical protein
VIAVTTRSVPFSPLPFSLPLALLLALVLLLGSLQPILTYSRVLSALGIFIHPLHCDTAAYTYLKPHLGVRRPLRGGAVEGGRK